jgi:hypothetical protein
MLDVVMTSLANKTFQEQTFRTYASHPISFS